MTFSYRDNLRQRPNFAIMGTEIPERLRRTLPAWTRDSPLIQPPNPANPFGDPPRPTIEVDPPESNPYNDPDWSQFIVTENRSGGEPAGGLLGMLQAAIPQRKLQLGVDSVSTFNGTSEYNLNNDGSPQGGLLGRWLALLQDEKDRNTVDVYGSNDPVESRVTPIYAAAPSEIPTTPKKPVRILSRRLVR